MASISDKAANLRDAILKYIAGGGNPLHLTNEEVKEAGLDTETVFTEPCAHVWIKGISSGPQGLKYLRTCVLCLTDEPITEQEFYSS